MKKILFILMLLCFLIGMGRDRTKEYTHPINDKQNTDNVEKTTTPKTLKNASITITAVGDCTLATDVSATGVGSFVSTLSEQNNDYSYFFKNVKDYFLNDDLTIVNFEGTLSNRGTRADKQFAFRGAPEYVNILTSSYIDAANLSNNHSRDYGDVSKTDTIENLTNAGILSFSAEKIAVCEIKGIKIAMIGINALNDREQALLDSVMEAAKKENPDLIIASFHWGVEKAAAPNQAQKDFAHRAIDQGADLVIGTHPHVLEGIEKYNGKYILYSLGNFCFGGNKNPSDKDTIIFRETFTFSEDSLLDNDDISIIPCRISSVDSKNDYAPTPATGEQKEKIINKITKYTKELSPELSLKFE